MIDRILPDGVAAVWATEDAPDAALFPAEEARVRNAVASRRREFATGRHCARLALGRIGIPPTAIPTGPRGAPLWPEGVVGSITHCSGYRAAAVARRDAFGAIGVDAEEHRPLPTEVRSMVLLPEEREHTRRLAAAAPRIHWPTIVFSAKEALYKAWFPLTGRWLGFHDARIRPGLDGTFTVEVLVATETIDKAPLPAFDGHWHTDHHVVVTSISAAY